MKGFRIEPLALIRQDDLDLAVAMQVTGSDRIGSARSRSRNEAGDVLKLTAAAVQGDGDRATRPGRVVETGITDHQIGQTIAVEICREHLVGMLRNGNSSDEHESESNATPVFAPT